MTKTINLPEVFVESIYNIDEQQQLLKIEKQRLKWQQEEDERQQKIQKKEEERQKKMQQKEDERQEKMQKKELRLKAAELKLQEKAHERNSLISGLIKLREEQLKPEYCDDDIDSLNDYERDEKNRVICHDENYTKFFEIDRIYGGRFSYNKWSGRIYMDKRLINNKDIRGIQNRIKSIFKNKKFCPINTFNTALGIEAEKYEFDPITDYLVNLKWDGIKRLETVFIDYLYVEDIPLVRSMTKRWFLGAVARALKPGCDFQQMIVLSGKGGLGKSNMGKILANAPCRNIDDPDRPNLYFLDGPCPNDKDKEVGERISNIWILGIDELGGFNKASVEAIKSFISKDKETFRDAYGFVAEDHYRHCVLYGTTNEEYFLKDYTGDDERRFWCMKCGEGKYKLDEITQDYLDQIWAEAVYYYKNRSFNWWLDDDEREMLGIYQKQFKTCNNDARLDLIRRIFAKEYILNNNLEFDSELDFKQQFNGISFNKMGKKCKIDRIPFTYVDSLMKDYKYKTPSTQYIHKALSGILDIKLLKYNAVEKTRCFIDVNNFRDKRSKEFRDERDGKLENLFNV